VLQYTNEIALEIKPSAFENISTVLLEAGDLVTTGPPPPPAPRAAVAASSPPCRRLGGNTGKFIPNITKGSTLFGPEDQLRMKQFATLLSFFATSVEDVMLHGGRVAMDDGDDLADLGNLFQVLSFFLLLV
jgi:hypothetical protein